MPNRIEQELAQITKDGSPLPHVGQIQFSGEEMAILTLGVGIMASMLVQDKQQIKAGAAILVSERDAIMPVLARIVTKLTAADEALPFLAPGEELQ